MNLWKRKLAAYLHDPPSKAVSIADHEQHAQTLYRQAGFSDEEALRFSEQFAKPSDWTASAADRMPFPNSQASGLRCAFDGVGNSFLHPLGPADSAQGPLRLEFSGPFLSSDVARETDQVIQPCLTSEQLASMDETLAWRARFFAHWRFWQRNAVERDYRFALLPADTRLPDHSVWTHMQVVSALDSCAEGVGKDAVLKPAFLKFQLGPVQDFIAAARSTRDLWSGSYLLSWLMAAGLKALSAETGPDAVIYPSLRNQPLFDLHWRKDLWNVLKFGGRTAWESLGHQQRDLLTPNLPNVFLAVVPAAEAARLADVVAEAIKREWHDIAEHVWQLCEKAGLTADEGANTTEQRRQRFDAQVSRFLQLSWQATPWPESLEAAMKLAEGFDPEMPIRAARCRVEAVANMAQTHMPVEHRDRRYYTDDSKTRLNNIGLGWSVLLALNSWQLDAVRQTRDFGAWTMGGWTTGTSCNKDALNGRDEAVAGGETWGKRAQAAGGFWPSLFKKNDWIGAATLVKRTWHVAYLAQAPWDLKSGSKDLPVPSTRGIAAHAPEASDDDLDPEEGSEDKYFAVLALDGDQIGKWVSGERTPAFETQLADYKDGSGTQRQGAKPYFENARFGDFLAARRPLSPSYHLQFSEALSNFARLCARPVVEAFDGRLIYAGGDDVLALLPADSALACAQALRVAFRGEPSLENLLAHAVGQLPPDRKRYFHQLAQNRFLLQVAAPGFVRSGDTRADHAGEFIPFLVPGPAADCSVGIAIAHFKAPLQDVVRAAQAAEKRAKRNPEHGGLGRSAVAVTLMKRSGEIIEWGARWKEGLELYRELARALEADELSSKFPHRFAELLEAYTTDSTPLIKANKSVEAVRDFPVQDIIRREFEHCLGRQRGAKFPREKQDADDLMAKLLDALNTYLGSLGAADSSDSPATEKILRSVIGLCQTVAFAHRTRSES